ncbi:hypothetical protein ACFPRL_16360 [Pseudoclavibacter helvolus]
MKQSASSHHPRLQIDHWYSNVAEVSEVLWVRQTTVTPGTKSLHARRTAANRKARSTLYLPWSGGILPILHTPSTSVISCGNTNPSPMPALRSTAPSARQANRPVRPARRWLPVPASSSGR